jgi:hypothetical protein
MLLQHPVEVEGVLGVGGEGARLCEVIMLDRLGLGMLCMMLHARPSEGTLDGYEAILPRDDGSFPATQLLLPSKELLLKLLHLLRHRHHDWRRRGGSTYTK